MIKLERYCLLLSFNLSVFSMTFLITAAASNYWTTAVIQRAATLDRHEVTGTLHYGLYKGRITLQSPQTRRYQLHVSCSGFQCAFTCKTTWEARISYVMNMGIGYHSKSDECDDNGELDMNRPLLSDPQTINFFLFYGINALLYTQLIITACSVLIAAVAICVLEAKLVHGLHFLMGFNFMSVLLGLTLLIIWGNLYANTLRHHLAFPYLAAHDLKVFPAIGYSYWLVFLAVIFSIGSTVMTFIRAEYLRREMLNTYT